jgi:hypothetical protein
MFSRFTEEEKNQLVVANGFKTFDEFIRNYEMPGQHAGYTTAVHFARRFDADIRILCDDGTIKILNDDASEDPDKLPLFIVHLAGRLNELTSHFDSTASASPEVCAQALKEAQEHAASLHDRLDRYEARLERRAAARQRRVASGDEDESNVSSNVSDGEGYCPPPNVSSSSSSTDTSDGESGADDASARYPVRKKQYTAACKGFQAEEFFFARIPDFKVLQDQGINFALCKVEDAVAPGTDDVPCFSWVPEIQRNWQLGWTPHLHQAKPVKLIIPRTAIMVAHFQLMLSHIPKAALLQIAKAVSFLKDPWITSLGTRTQAFLAMCIHSHARGLQEHLCSCSLCPEDYTAPANVACSRCSA